VSLPKVSPNREKTATGLPVDGAVGLARE